jgi:hypothetical protein
MFNMFVMCLYIYIYKVRCKTSRIVEVQGSVSVLQWFCHILSFSVNVLKCLKKYKALSTTGQAKGGSQGTVELSVKPWSRNGMLLGKVCSPRAGTMYLDITRLIWHRIFSLGYWIVRRQSMRSRLLPSRRQVRRRASLEVFGCCVQPVGTWTTWSNLNSLQHFASLEPVLFLDPIWSIRRSRRSRNPRPSPRPRERQLRRRQSEA